MSVQSPKQSLRTEVARLVRLWVLLLLVGAVEFGASFLPLGHLGRPLIMIPAIAMIGLVAFGFMNVTKGPVIVRTFAVAALFWLLILLALGSVDPLTRVNYTVPTPDQR